MSHRFLILVAFLLFPLRVLAQPSFEVLGLGADANPRALHPTAPIIVGSVLGAPVKFDLPPLRTVLGELMTGFGGLAHGIAGQSIVGEARTGPNGFFTHAWRLLDHEGTLTLVDLGTLGGPHLFSSATTVAEDGTAFGYGDNTTITHQVPIRWGLDGAAIELPTLGGRGIIVHSNANHQAVGQSATSAGRTHCALWDAAGAITDCHPVPTARTSTGRSLNSAGDLVGLVLLPAQRGFLRLADGTVTLLEPLPGFHRSDARGLTNAGADGVRWIIGQSVQVFPDEQRELPRATLWRVEGGDVTIYDLNTLITTPGWVLTTGIGINAEQQFLLGFGLNPDGVSEAFLARLLPPAVPAPLAPQPPDRKGDKRRPRERGR